MEIKYHVQEADYIDFNLHHIQDSPSQKKLAYLLRFILPLLCGLAIYYIGTHQFKQPSVYWVAVALFFMGWWIIYYQKRHKKTVKKQIEKLLSEGDNSSLFGEKTLLITDDCIEVAGGSTSERFLKEDIKKIKVYDDLIVIYLSSISVHIIPTRYLDEETKDYLIDYFRP